MWKLLEFLVLAEQHCIEEWMIKGYHHVPTQILQIKSWIEL